MTAVRFIGTVVWRDTRLALSSRVPFMFDVLAVIVSLAIFYFVGRFVGRTGGAGFLAFVTAGVSAMQLQSAVLRAVHGLDREQASGGLEMLLVSPVRPAIVAVAVVAFPILRGGAFALIALVVSRTVFGVELTLGPGAWPGIALGLAGAVLGFVIVTMACFGVLIALRQGPAAASLFGLVLPMMSGIYFPVSLLPAPLDAIASASPLTMAVDLVRDAVLGRGLELGDVAVMLIVLAVGVVLAGLVCEAVVLRAKRLGTLSHS